MAFKSLKSRLQSLSSRTSLNPNVKQQLRNRLDIEMAKETAEPAKSETVKWRRNLPQMAAVILPLAVIITGVGYWTNHGIHVPQVTANNPTTSRTVTPHDKITITDIKSYYAKTAQPASSILNITSYPKYNAVIVESHINVPNLKEPNDFEWWNLKTGKHFVLVGRPTYAQLQQVTSADEVVFLASGKNAETPQVSFPYYIYDRRTNTNSDFTPNFKPAFFPVEKSFSFGDSKVEAVSKLTASTDSLKMNFAPLKNDNGSFYAGSTGAPETRTVYLKNQNEMVLRFQKTNLTASPAELQTLHNAFVQSVSAHMSGTELDVTLHLTQKSKFYSISVNHSNHPSLTISFATQSPMLG